ncbi:MAG: hypothetical protein K9J13_07540 [Saprospiraceae bacterium]|nr:hypothetical protein [Saprospiraceae bacterium]
MKDIAELLKYLTPSIVVLVTAYLIIRNFLKNEEKRRTEEIESENKKRLLEYKFNNQKLITPLRLQAYERIILLLERISPLSMLLRENIPGVTVHQMHNRLLKTIREEFEHNLSQQLYISQQAWKLVKNAKEEITQLVNTASHKLDEKATSVDLNNKIIELTVEKGKLQTEIALEFLKKEIQEIF